ncbi:hypothetical protein ACSS7Z_06630 [Microbacterium sp. A82]|uniref:hypothetical protein n=1 Tax=Microbacterium sp. A82 TaxID=3450452 RepID=UPI003F3FC648
MEWISDVSVGDWLRERLNKDLAENNTMHSVVPSGFEAYARIFHPAQVRSLPDRAVPTMDEWNRMPDAEHARLSELFVDAPASWAGTADAFGTTMHALAQWQRLVKTPPDGDWRTRIAPDGREFTSPFEGEIPPTLLAAIARHLIVHTSTPDAGFAAIWEGWGGFVGHFGETSSRAFLEFTDDPAHAQVLQQSFHDRFNNPFRKAKWQPGIVSDEISQGQRLSLPSRDHVLFSAAPAVFADPDWVLGVPWRDRPAEEHGFAPEAQHPSILWPADRAWVMVSEIDYDSTIVAGSAALIQALCADAALEALPIPEGASLHWDADTINR